MLLDVFVCCSPADRPVAETIAARLAHGAEARVAIDDGVAETVASKWEGGALSSAIVVLLSPDSVPVKVSREEWGDLLDHVAGNTQPPVATVLVRDCGFPRILDRKNFFRWGAGDADVLREIERWVLQLHQLPRERSFAPARLPWFNGREQELRVLWEALVDRSGCVALVSAAPGSGKTSLAQEFARHASANFRDVIWVGCGDRSAVSILGELASRVGGADYSAEPDQALAEILETAGQHRVLVVFDDFRGQLVIHPGPYGRASVLLTGRTEPSGGAVIVRLEPGEPAALAVPDEEVDRDLWRAGAVCRAAGFPIELARRIANLNGNEAAAACARLIVQRVLDPCDAGGRIVRLNARSIAAAAGEATLAREQLRHAEIVLEVIKHLGNVQTLDQDVIPEFLPAFHHAKEASWPLACDIAKRAFALLYRHHRVAEAVELLVALRDAADERGEWQVSDECAWELSWIRGVPYRGAPRVAGAGHQLSLEF